MLSKEEFEENFQISKAVLKTEAETDMAGVLQREGEATTPPLLMDTPVLIKTFSTPNASVFCADFPDYQLYGPSLINLLLMARPKPKLWGRYDSQGRLGILADWELAHDRFNQDYQQSDRVKYLLEVHRSIGFEWAEFVALHLNSLWNALCHPDLSEIDKYVDNIISRVVSKAFAADNFFSIFGSGDERSKSKEYIMQLGISRTLESINRWLAQEGKADLVDPMSVEGLTLRDSRSLTRKFPKDLISDLIDQGILQNNRIVVNTNRLPYQVLSSRQASLGKDNNVSLDYLGSNIILVRVGTSWEMFHLDGDKTTELERFIDPCKDAVVLPRISWVESAGQRFYLATNFFDELMRDTDPKADPTVGLAVVSALSPERVKLPHKETTPEAKDKKKNAIREAQILLHLSRNRKRVMRWQIFDALEAAA